MDASRDCTDPPLPDDPETLQGMIRVLLLQLQQKDRELDGVRRRLDALLRRLYGPRSERLRPDQPSLFAEPGDSPPPPDASSPPSPPAPPARTASRSRHGRRRLPADLPRERVLHVLPAAEQRCPCCQQARVCIGEEVSEQLDYRPAQLFVRQHVRLKYACPACLAARLADGVAAACSSADGVAAAAAAEGSAAVPTAAGAGPAVGDAVPVPGPAGASADGELPAGPAHPDLVSMDTESTSGPDAAALIVTAPKPPQPIDRGLPGPGLLAYVITSKYADHLPLHRQEAILARQGVELSRSTLCDWMAAAARLLQPLYAELTRQVLQSRVVHTDGTHVPVLEDGRSRTRSACLWVYVGDVEHPFLVYDYRPTKSRDGPLTMLRGYRGFLQADAANVFDELYLPGAITEVACWAHARRHFYEARTSDAARAAEALARIRRLYQVEDQAAEQIAAAKLSDAAADAVRWRLRQEQTRPLLAALADWLEAQVPAVLPKSPIGQAVAYARRHWQALQRFTEHGFLAIDNNAAERASRAVAVGRKNWLFAGSDQGGQTAAALYTLTQTCKHHRIDPYAYLQDVLTRLPQMPAAGLEALLPTRWAAEQRARVTSGG